MGDSKKTLVIVESPSKAKTIGKFLGANYKVMASVGHIRDLPKSKLGIDVENNFEPQYISIRGKGDLIKELKKEAKSSDKVYLATDPDREGEAISWHLAHILGIEKKQPCRIVFNEITKPAIKNAVKNPRAIDEKLVDAQQARRVLDRLVGYQISPLLWRKVRFGLSAGRVQSAALKIICDRENLIKAFVPEEYWNINVDFEKKEASKKKKFSAKLTEFNGKKITVKSGEEAAKITAQLEKGQYKVVSVEEKERAKKPYAPFTTSALQQEASTKLNFSPKKTMMVAQQLYEGIEIKGNGTVGLVTYIRTDSVRISQEAKEAAKKFITENYGAEQWSDNVFSNKKKDVQDAHEAIRPSDVNLTPDKIKASLTKEQYNLYKIIWSRFIASQMQAAIYNNVSVEIENNGYGLRATGSKLVKQGYLAVYMASDDVSKDKILPSIEKGEILSPIDISGEQNFTQPPSRFTEASLVKDLEEKNIGRPSTYAPIIGTLLERKYVIREKKSLMPTELGYVVTQMMEEYFKEIVDVGFTADLEDKLDDVEIKNIDWRDIIAEFYVTLKAELEYADEKIEKVKLEDELTGELCELCGKPMARKHGRFGEFIACTGYPECRNTKQEVKTTGVKCPECDGDIVVKRGRKGRVFYGCSNYPNCTKSYWYMPTEKKCPKCGELLVEKSVKGSKYSCSNQECDYTE